MPPPPQKVTYLLNADQKAAILKNKIFKKILYKHSKHNFKRHLLIRDESLIQINSNIKTKRVSYKHGSLLYNPFKYTYNIKYAK